MGQGTLIIAIDKEVSAVAIISVPYQYLDKVTDEFSEIKHIKEMEGNRDKYLKEYFKPILEKVLDKYPIEIRYYLKVDHYFWEDLEYLSKWGTRTHRGRQPVDGREGQVRGYSSITC